MLRRLWCAGYDMHAPPRSVAFHMWSRQGRPALAACVPQARSLKLLCHNTRLQSNMGQMQAHREAEQLYFQRCSLCYPYVGS